MLVEDEGVKKMVVKNIIKDMWPSLWPMLVFASVVVISIRGAYLLKSSRKVTFHKEFMYLVFMLYVICLYYILVYNDVDIKGVNMAPFSEIFRYSIGSYKFMKNVVGSIIIFIPFGFFTSYYINSKKIRTPIIISFIVSLAAEGIQYYSEKIFNIDDIILNVLGGFLGYLLYVALTAIKSKLPNFLRSDKFINIMVIVIVVIVILLSMGINIFKYL